MTFKYCIADASKEILIQRYSASDLLTCCKVKHNCTDKLVMPRQPVSSATIINTFVLILMFYYKNNSITLDAHTVRESTKEYLLELIKRRQIQSQKNPTYYGMRNSSTNYATEIYRLDSLTFQNLGKV